jgi:hypothetical protein
MKPRFASAVDFTGAEFCYLQVSIRKLKEIHTATHPARAKRSP